MNIDEFSDGRFFYSLEDILRRHEVNPINTEPFESDRWQEALDVMEQNADVYERRRKRRKRITSSFFQEEGLDPAEVNIISDGAGDTAELTLDPGQSWVTTVVALPPTSILYGRVYEVKGDDANDLIIPWIDFEQSLDAGGGDNVVYLGLWGGSVVAKDGHDTIFAWRWT